MSDARGGVRVRVWPGKYLDWKLLTGAWHTRDHLTPALTDLELPLGHVQLSGRTQINHGRTVRLSIFSFNHPLLDLCTSCC